MCKATLEQQSLPSKFNTNDPCILVDTVRLKRSVDLVKKQQNLFSVNYMLRLRTNATTNEKKGGGGGGGGGESTHLVSENRMFVAPTLQIFTPHRCGSHDSHPPCPNGALCQHFIQMRDNSVQIHIRKNPFANPNNWYMCTNLIQCDQFCISCHSKCSIFRWEPPTSLPYKLQNQSSTVLVSFLCNLASFFLFFFSTYLGLKSTTLL